jgi:hypothetical protein
VHPTRIPNHPPGLEAKLAGDTKRVVLNAISHYLLGLQFTRIGSTDIFLRTSQIRFSEWTMVKIGKQLLVHRKKIQSKQTSRSLRCNVDATLADLTHSWAI